MQSLLGDLFSSPLKVNRKDGKTFCCAQTDILRVSDKQTLQNCHERIILK